MVEPPKIYRVFVSGSIRNLIVVLLDKPNENSVWTASFAQAVLNLPSTHNLGEEWPFEDSITLQKLLEEVDLSLAGWSEYAQYIRHQHFHALGLGPVKRQQERAALLGVTLSALLTYEDPQRAFPSFAGRGASFEQEVAMVRQVPVKEVRPAMASNVAAAARPRTAFNIVNVKKPTAEHDIKLPEEHLLRRWKGLGFSWMPECAVPITMENMNVEPVSDQIFNASLGEARASFQEEFRKPSKKQHTPKGRFFFDLTRSFPPWPCIVAGHAEKVRIVGEGITSFKVVMDKNITDPVQKAASVFFEAKQQNGEVYSFHSLARSHQTMRWDRTEEDVTLAFQLAGGFGLNLELVRQFKADARPKGWKRDDFRLSEDALLAWVMSESLQRSFTAWLARREPTEPTAASAVEKEPLRDGMLRELDRARAQSFSHLDPCSNPTVLEKFSHLVQCFASVDSKVRYTHETISENFLHGHRGQPINRLMSQLKSGTTDALKIAPLVAVKHKGFYYVISGNRRLYAYKNCGTPVVFKMIVHHFPDFPDLNTSERETLTTKALRAASSTTRGQEVQVRRNYPSQQQAAKTMRKRPAEPQIGETGPVDLALQPCPKPRPEKKAMPRPAKKAMPAPKPAHKAMPRPNSKPTDAIIIV